MSTFLGQAGSTVLVQFLQPIDTVHITAIIVDIIFCYIPLALWIMLFFLASKGDREKERSHSSPHEYLEAAAWHKYNNSYSKCTVIEPSSVASCTRRESLFGLVSAWDKGAAIALDQALLGTGKSVELFIC